MEITFFEINKKDQLYIKKELKKFKLKFFKETIQEVDISKYKTSNIISVFIYSKVNRKIIESIPNLKSIITRSTGFDHIDLNTCNYRNISIGNVPFYGENTVAEHTL